jgi:hypothetical protein
MQRLKTATNLNLPSLVSLVKLLLKNLANSCENSDKACIKQHNYIIQTYSRCSTYKAVKFPSISNPRKNVSVCLSSLFGRLVKLTEINIRVDFLLLLGLSNYLYVYMSIELDHYNERSRIMPV